MTWVNGSDNVRLLLRENKVVGCVYRDTRLPNVCPVGFWRANQDKETLYVSEEAAKRAAELAV
jgi:hypothetical protein